ncbi:MAG: hypothetical protein ACOWWM_09590 [Desulfobacterales bacterium]
MTYKPCQFDRQYYLDNATAFETGSIDDAEAELCEFSEDAEDIAFELAYTRYVLAKTEKALIEAIEAITSAEEK